MISLFLIKDILLFIFFLSDKTSGHSGFGGGIMYDAYLVNETDFVVQTQTESFLKGNQTMTINFCAMSTRYNSLQAFKIKDEICLMGNISLTGKPDLNGTMVFVDSDHARATLNYGKFDLGTFVHRNKTFFIQVVP